MKFIQCPACADIVSLPLPRVPKRNGALGKCHCNLTKGRLLPDAHHARVTPDAIVYGCDTKSISEAIMGKTNLFYLHRIQVPCSTVEVTDKP